MIISQLTTGDYVLNKTTGTKHMIAVVSPNVSGILTISDLTSNPDNWELAQSRLYTSDTQLKKLVEYHEAIKKMAENNKK